MAEEDRRYRFIWRNFAEPIDQVHNTHAPQRKQRYFLWLPFLTSVGACC